MTVQHRSDHSSTERLQLRSMLRALRNSNVSVTYQNCNLRYDWAENLPEFWSLRWRPGISEADFMPESAAEKLTSAKMLVLESGEPQTLELSFQDQRHTRWYEFFIDSDRDQNGTIIGLVTTTVEISELKRREQVLKILLREVSHRSKNLLAIIQSIAMQTARFTGTVDDFLYKFRGRLHSLAYSQDLVTDSNWHGARFQQLIHSQFEKYINPSDSRLTIIGNDVYLFPGAALHVGLAFHELIVNSTSYGVLAHENGRLQISANIQTTPQGDPDLIIHWQENIDPPRSEPPDTPTHKTSRSKALLVPHAPQAPRFGSAVLERIVPQAVNGSASYVINNNCVDYSLRMPHSNFDY